MPAFATSADGVPIAYEVDGPEGLAVVLVHGWCCDRTLWDAQIVPLSSDVLVARLDLAGHGQSGASRTDWSMTAFGADVSAVMSAANLADVILVGHSMGADVVLETARRAKGRVRGLVWVDQYNQLSTFMSEARVQERVAPFRTSFARTTRTFVQGMFSRTSDADLIERVAAHMASARESIALAALEATWNHGRAVPELLAEVSLPIVSINAGKPFIDMDSMNQHGVHVMPMQGVGHFPMLEKPAEFNACLARAVELICHGRNDA